MQAAVRNVLMQKPGRTNAAERLLLNTFFSHSWFVYPGPAQPVYFSQRRQGEPTSVGSARDTFPLAPYPRYLNYIGVCGAYRDGSYICPAWDRHHPYQMGPPRHTYHICIEGRVSFEKVCTPASRYRRGIARTGQIWVALSRSCVHSALCSNRVCPP